MSTNPPPQYSPDGRFWWDGARWVPVAAQQLPIEPRTEPMAIISMALGVGGLLCVFAAPVALILGIVSARRITASGGALSGLAFARAGWILGATVIILYIGLFVLIALSCSGSPHPAGCS